MKFSVGSGDTALNYEVRKLGADYLILLTGGDIHIGCTAIGDDGRIVSYTPLHHRDDALAIPLAKKISQEYRCICTVVAGFHLDNISKEQIVAVIENSKIGMKQLLENID
ncbi:MAG: gallate decarboxylase subunit [Eubacteriaceae bacterium]|jgi:hypothetical protein|nr:gallate decarboxylase subunit [Eubacteriaceae bacterium]MDN5308047.1 gallate decarboxylase subunit [Eubacteriaceae bacterium]